ncbi:MAG: beta-CASP ribonuclease aCPSF1 [Candidatus Nanoarchaeia archaeon]
MAESLIIKEILKQIPEGKISEANFEAANIVLYTKDKDFFLDNKGTIKKIVDTIKKRIELRPDPEIVMDTEEAQGIIKKLIPEEAGISDVIFDLHRSRVIIHAEKPGLAIGKQGALLRDVREKTLWVPLVKRTPAIRSNIVEDIRSVLYENSDYRRKFLDKVGHRIYDGWIRGKKNEWVRVTYLGGARQVGRSCIFLQTPESRILLDCGINPANEDEAYPYLEAPEFKIDELDAVILTNSLIDHSGLLPYLYKFGYKGPVYCTAPTRDIAAMLQLDFIKNARSEGKEPIYSAEEVREFVKHTVCLDYGEVSDVTPDVRITLYNAGHILGSSMIHLHIGNGLHNLVYTGSMKFARTQLLEPAETRFPRLETLMIESTYGAKDAILPNPREQDRILGELIANTVKRKGQVLMPTLGTGRAQEVMILLEKLIREGRIDKIPVYIDGMIWDITAIHTAYPEFLNHTVRKQIFHKDNNPFLSPIFKRVENSKERKEIIEKGEPAVIIATSGMLEGGPSVEYLKGLSKDKNNCLIFTCYQAEGSLGAKVKRGDKRIVLGTDATGKPHVLPINLEVHKVEMSSHSDRRELMNFVGRCQPKPKKVIVSNGENIRCLDFASSVHRTYRVETTCPRNLETVRIK